MLVPYGISAQGPQRRNAELPRVAKMHVADDVAKCPEMEILSMPVRPLIYRLYLYCKNVS